MQIQNQGLAQAQNFIQQQRTFGMAQPFSVSSMFITPSQRIGALQEQQSRMYGRDLTAAQVAAAPSPMAQAAQTAFTNFGGTVGGALSQYGLSSALMSDYSNMMRQTPQIDVPNLMAPPPSMSAPSVRFGP
jgi:hypothetical protein